MHVYHIDDCGDDGAEFQVPHQLAYGTIMDFICQETGRLFLVEMAHSKTSILRCRKTQRTLSD